MKYFSIVLLGIFIIAYIVPLGVRPMVIPDETRYAEIPREMLKSGNWVAPRLDGFRYFEKPVLGYWFNALSIKCFGQNAFAIRLPSALAVGLSALLIFLLVRQFGGEKRTGLLASGVFLTCVEVFVVGVFCVLDSVFSLFITATIISFYFAYQAESRGKKTFYLVLTGFSCGLAFLTKGFIAFAVPFITVVSFLLWERQVRKWWKFLWIPMVTAFTVALPWCIMIGLRESDYWRYFFWEEHIRRFLGNDAQHAEPFWLYVPVLIGGALPWTAVLSVIVVGLRKVPLKDSFLRFVLCWLAFPFLFFSLSRGKLGTYILPCFPPLAIITTLGLLKYFSAHKTRIFDVIVRGCAIFIMVGAVGVVLVHTMLPKWAVYSSTETWKWIFLAVGLLSYSLFLIWATCNTEASTQIAICCVGPVFLMFAGHFITPDRLKNGKMPEEFLSNHSNMISPESIIISDQYLTPAVCWCYKRDNIYLLGRTGEFTYGAGYEDTHHKVIANKDFINFVKQNAKGNKVILITRESRYDSRRKLLPTPVNEIRKNGFILAEYRSLGQ